ncbi:hypothetical protein GH733_003008 [Mirounga leonina]|nr:hypothetical protein GH733_003008 [Mirounga leonina]
MSFPKYEPSRLATLPSTLDPAEYNVSPEARKAEAERLAIRSRLKREYLLQYNDPSRQGLIEDPALIRWTYARSANIYPNFRPTPKTSLLGALFGIGPLFFWFYVFKTDRNMDIRPGNEMKIKQFAKNCGAENQNELGSRIISCPDLPTSDFFYEIKS